MAKEEKQNPEGWPDNDPYPFRKKEVEEAPESDFVRRYKNYVETNEFEAGDLPAIWRHINELTQKIKELEANIKWLENMGGERLNLACGIDIISRDIVIKSRK